MGCALGSAADHAVAKATQRVEKDQVIEKAVQRALHAAVAELQHVEVTLRVSPRHASDSGDGAGLAAPVSPMSPVSSPCSPGPSGRFLEKGVRRGRAADWCATSLSKAEQVIITEEGWSRFFYYAFANMDDAMEVFQAWPHTARVLYSFDASAGCLVQELEADAGASVGWSLNNIRGRAEALMLPDESENCTDYHNALKLGFDVEALEWPKWLRESELGPLLPKTVFTPGETIGFVGERPAARFGLPNTCRVAAGTTDSIAAFLAAGTTEVGEAVTSLGSTLAVKLRSLVRVDDAAFGVYSHRLGGDPVQSAEPPTPEVWCYVP
ncbi:unnamed protein product [Cladocopium goreaui]|uniref:D-ribulose kinase (D-ribulokinase) (Inactiv e Xylulose kinase 1) (Atxk-1) n=1 Tax=Cladocopium goreaui TaxID=2562237 RepID=A0A9P1FMU5_9DINO|nr:unnamed protein product [Cladocopium goreaui]